MNKRKNIMIGFVLAIAIFFVDIETPLELEFWILYFIPLFITSRALDRRSVPWLPFIGTILIVVDYFISPGGEQTPTAAGNRALEISAMWLVSVIIMHGKRAEEALDRSYEELEKRVEERTADLANTNAALQDEISERNKVESELKQLSLRNELILKSAGEGIFGLDLSGNYTFINKMGAAMLGYTPEEMLGKHSHSLNHYIRTDGSLYPDHECKTYGAAKDCTTRHVDDEIFVKKDGSTFPVEYTAAPLVENDRVTGAVVTFNDITQRKKAEEEIRSLNSKHKLLLDFAGEGILGIDMQGKIMFANKAAADMLGYEPDELTGKRAHATIHYAKPDGAPYPEEECPVYWTEKDEAIHSGEEVFWRKNGASFPVDFKSIPIKENGTKGAVITFRDVTERKRMEDEIRHMAYHDALTGLPNRRLFVQIMNVELREARRHRKKLAVLFLDLDRFKEINDTLGHEIGDELLKTVALRLKSVIRESDTIARIGGDEFNVIISDIDHPEYTADVARKLMKAIREPFTIRGQNLSISTSIGISIFPDDNEDIDLLFRYADIAMYYAKGRGRNTFQFYNPDINVRSLETMRFEGYLRQTIERGELVVHYQPQFTTRSGKIVSAEALVRWNHPELGLLQPSQFIPMAEEIGFISSIDQWVLKTACAQFRAWIDQGKDHPLFVAVNLSARIFQAGNFIEMISRILEETGLPPDRLEIEITESVAMANIERTAALLKELTEKGIRITIDDFGTGYSSLNYLKRLPIQRLKIDRSFVKDIATDSDDRAIIKAVTAMAHNMKIKVVAEGVETEEQLSFLLRVQCDEAQGFFLQEPMSADKFSELISAR